MLAWARGPHAGGLRCDCLSDPRVSGADGDVRALGFAERPAAFDAILLDVDNGPEALARSDNDALYAASGLTVAQRALRPRGVLAVWSAGEDTKFAKRLSQGGFEVEEIKVRANGAKGGARHIIWLARLPG